MMLSGIIFSIAISANAATPEQDTAANTQKNEELSAHKEPVTNKPLSQTFQQKFLLGDTHDRRLAKHVSRTHVQAPASLVMEILTDFAHFPEFMKRLKTCEVTKREDGFIYTESILKPQMFVRESRNHTITHIGSSPNTIHWVLVDGSFPSASGKWEILPSSDNDCQITYTVAVDPGPFFPTHMVAWALKLVQNELTGSLKHRAETLNKGLTASRGHQAHLPSGNLTAAMDDHRI